MKETIPFNKDKFEKEMRNASKKMSKLYEAVTTGGLNDASISQLESIKKRITDDDTSMERTNLWHTALYQKNIPFYNYLTQANTATVAIIDQTIKYKKLNFKSNF